MKALCSKKLEEIILVGTCIKHTCPPPHFRSRFCYIGFFSEKPATNLLQACYEKVAKNWRVFHKKPALGGKNSRFIFFCSRFFFFLYFFKFLSRFSFFFANSHKFVNLPKILREKKTCYFCFQKPATGGKYDTNRKNANTCKESIKKDMIWGNQKVNTSNKIYFFRFLKKMPNFSFALKS